MDADDPRTPLLGVNPRSRVRHVLGGLCGLQAWRRRVPITIWLPRYSAEFLLRDAIAGITVGLTSIPQGIAYAIIAGLPPQVGLYSSIFPGIVYAIFGSCKVVTVGPTAILAALLAKYVAISPDFAYLASFLSGCIILLLGVLQLGCLLDFISKPVISAFTTAAALQISASQLKTLFALKGASGETFIATVVSFFQHISTIQPWDTLLGFVTILILFGIKYLNPVTSLSWMSRVWTHAVRARNAIVVFAGALLAYCLHLRGVDAPFALTGKIQGGLPHFGPPPFSTTAGNTTLSFTEMISVFGAGGLAMPLVAVLESIAIAKAFAGTVPVDGTQEMLALGLCNVVSSFAQSMPATGSFTRTAINHAAGVCTPAGSLFKAFLVLLSVTTLSSAFYFIPRATLAAVIVVAMCSIVEFSIVRTLWRHSKVELAVWAATLCVGAGAGLEYGLACGLAVDAARALAAASDPAVHTTTRKVCGVACVHVSIVGALQFACAARVHAALRDVTACVVLVHGEKAGKIDLGVAENLVLAMQELESRGHVCLLQDFKPQHLRLLETLDPGIGRWCLHQSLEDYLRGMDPTRLGINQST